MCRPAGGGGGVGGGIVRGRVRHGESCRPSRPAPTAGRSTTADLATLTSFYEMGRKSGTFDAGVAMGIRRILASPDFVLRIERDPQAAAPGTIYRVGDIELASRLSFFLWSTLPDEELLRVASGNRLSDPVVLEQQVRRMLADPRSRALVDNFAGQWLYLRNLRSISPTPDEFPDFDDNLRQAIPREMELFFESIMREDRSVLDLLTADYTFVNERLARHYGIPNIYGSHFRRVTLPGDDAARAARQGRDPDRDLAGRPHLAGRPRQVDPRKHRRHAAAAAAAERARARREAGGERRPMTLRERMETHRKNPACARLPPDDGSDRLRARELRCRRRLADR